MENSIHADLLLVVMLLGLLAFYGFVFWKAMHGAATVQPAAEHWLRHGLGNTLRALF